MKKLFLLLLLCVSLLTSCRTSLSMQKEIRALRSDLYYELTTPVYAGEVNKDVYLNFIGDSNLDYYTSVEKAGRVFVPLLLYNYSNQQFTVTLGEGSLTQKYREFLTEAFLQECNSSTCFNLIDNAEGKSVPDSAYVLDVKITNNHTTSKVSLNGSSFLSPSAFSEDSDSEGFISVDNHKAKSAVTALNLHVCLMHGEEKLVDKGYAVNKKYRKTTKGFGDSNAVNQECLDNMSVSLSLATKEIVEEISQELNLILSCR